MQHAPHDISAIEDFSRASDIFQQVLSPMLEVVGSRSVVTPQHTISVINSCTIMFISDYFVPLGISFSHKSLK